jgi:hypothetical protein
LLPAPGRRGGGPRPGRGGLCGEALGRGQVNDPATLARLLAVIDASGVPGRLEALLPVGMRPRQLSVRTLLLGMLLTLAAGRPAHLSRVHEALVCQRPLGIPHRRPGEFHADGHRSALRDGHGKSPRTATSSPRGRPRELPADDWQTGSAVEGHDPLS